MTWYEYGKDFQKLSSKDRYLRPFIFVDDFRDDKRYLRYVSKIKNQCDRFMKEWWKSQTSLPDNTYDAIACIIKKDIINLYVDAIRDKDEVDRTELEKKTLATVDEPVEGDDELAMMKYTIRKSVDDSTKLDILELQIKMDKDFRFAYNYGFVDPNAADLWMLTIQTFFAQDYMNMLQKSDDQKDDVNEAAPDCEYDHKYNHKVMLHYIECEFEECCFQYLHSRIAEENSIINADNFVVHALPRGNGEILGVLGNVIDRALTDMFNSVRKENSLKYDPQTTTQVYVEAMNKAKAEKEEDEKVLQKEQEKNDVLRKKIAEYDDVKTKEFESLKTENQSLHMEKTRLEKRNLALEEECARLRAMLTTSESTEEASVQSSEESKDIDDIASIDPNLRYVFVMDENPYGKEQILEAFPNSTIVDDVFDVNPNYIDYVICITSRVRHSAYNPIKDQCKAKGVNFIHCVHGNVDMIKRAISRYEEVKRNK